MDTASVDPWEGRVLDDRYLIGPRIARGGMATVYQATDLRLERAVAVKVMHAGLASDADFVARFSREARAAASVSHPNVVAVTDQGIAHGQPFLVMEHVSGQTLRRLLDSRGRLPALEALDLLDPVLAGLAAAHAAGIVHRDVKPENVLISTTGQVKVTDFGLARAIQSGAATTANGVLLGTVAYLAPEQVAGHGADARSDVYSTGVMLSELLTGAAPHSGETPIAVAYQHVNTDVPAPSTVLPGLPPVVDDLVLSATARDPQRRPADAEALRAHLLTARRVVAMSSAGTGSTTAFPVSDAPTTALLLPEAGRPSAPTKASDPKASPAPRAKRRRRALIAWGVLALTAVAAVVLGWWLASGRYVKAPSLLGDTTSVAQTVAHRSGLSVRVDTATVFSETVAVGRVAEQSPKPGGQARRGGTVVVRLSKGPLRIAVPDVRGQSAAAATAALRGAHLTVAPAKQAFSDSVTNGSVISLDPPQGTKVRSGAPVTLTVSQGPAPVSVPDVRHRAKREAEQALAQLGLQAASVDAFSDTVAVGEVIDQTPAPGASVAKGTIVRLSVSVGPRQVKVPDVRGETSEQASADLEALGLKARLVLIDGSQDQVVSQSPKPGRTVDHGSTVTLYVA